MRIIKREEVNLADVDCLEDTFMKISYEGLAKLAKAKNVKIKDIIKTYYAGMYYIEISNNDKNLIDLVMFNNEYTKNMRAINLPTKDELGMWGSMIWGYGNNKFYEDAIHDIRVFIC